MTAFNREKYIAEAIESVLASTYTNFELIIVDDRSTDNTVEIANSYAKKDARIRVYCNPANIGDYPNRNIAASYALGKYLKYIDSDDRICKDGLEKMVASMELFPEAAFGISQFIFDESIQYPQLLSSEEAYRQHFYGKAILSYGPIGAIIRRDIFEKWGGFNPIRYISDTELWLKLAAQYPVVIIEPDVVFWRKHDMQEFIYGMNDFSYLRLAYPIYMRSIHDRHSPLNELDKKIITHRLQWKHARDILSLAIKKKHPVLAWKVFSESDFGWKKLISGAFAFRPISK